MSTAKLPHVTAASPHSPVTSITAATTTTPPSHAGHVPRSLRALAASATAAVVPAPRPLTCSPRLVRPIDRLAQKGFTASAAPSRPATATAETRTLSGKTTTNTNVTAHVPSGRTRSASTRPRTTAATRSRLVLFAEHPDRLLCDPANAVWVYCSYDFKFVHTDVKSRTQAERLIEQAMECAEVQYRRSVENFRHLPESVRRAHVMRDVPLTLTPTAPNTTNTNIVGRRETAMHERPGRTSRSNSISLLGKAPMRSSSPAALLRSPSTDVTTSHIPRAMPSGRTRSVTEEKARQMESEIYAMLLRQWPSVNSHGGEEGSSNNTSDMSREGGTYTGKGEAGTRGTTTTTTNTSAQVPAMFLSLLRHSTLSTATSATGTSYSLQHPIVGGGGNSTSMPGISNAVRHAMRSRAHLKVKLFVDIVASRKSLRDVPTESKPYRLGQHLYHYVEEHYPDTVMHMCVGLSDAKVRLTCRDLLFPYRRMPVGTMVTAEEDAQHITTSTTQGKNTFMGYNAVVSPRGHYEANYGNAAHHPFGSEAMMMMMRGQKTPFLSPHTRLPPVTPDMIDQRRMLICFSANTRASAQT